MQLCAKSNACCIKSATITVMFTFLQHTLNVVYIYKNKKKETNNPDNKNTPLLTNA